MNAIDSHSMKKQKKEGLGFTDDRISALPDEIISNILSFLSTREAAATSILSPRWSDLWKHTPNLDFSGINSIKIKEMCHRVKMINSALESHQALFLERFRICFYINKSAQSEVTKWLEFVWSRRVKRLELDFLCLNAKQRVALGDLRPMKCLETLCLGGMQMSGEDISLFLGNCPLLRELSITNSSLTSDVHVSGATLALKSLEICRCYGSDVDIITISAPNLSIVSVDAAPGKLRFENVPKLVDAKFRVITQGYTVDHFCSKISCFTSQLQKLTLIILCYERLLRKGFPQLPNLKTLVIEDMSYKNKDGHAFLLATTHVISACPRLQKLILLFDNAGRGGATMYYYYKKSTKLVFEGSCAANIIQSVTYVSESYAFQRINTWTALPKEDNLYQIIKAQLCQQVQFQFQVQLQFDVHWNKSTPIPSSLPRPSTNIVPQAEEKRHSKRATRRPEKYRDYVTE